MIDLFSGTTNRLRFLTAVFLTLSLVGPAFAGHKFPNVELTSHEGKVYRFQDDLIDDKVVVINFIYTACKTGICAMPTLIMTVGSTSGTLLSSVALGPRTPKAEMSMVNSI